MMKSGLDLNCPLPYRNLEAKRGQQQAPEKTAGGLLTFIRGRGLNQTTIYALPELGIWKQSLDP